MVLKIKVKPLSCQIIVIYKCEDKTLDMIKLVVGLMMLTLFIIISTVNNPLVAKESQNADTSASFLTYNDTAYGISIEYPSNWQIDQSANEYMLAILQNLTSQPQGGNDNHNNAVKSKVSEILDAFGLGSVLDVIGLSPDKRAEILQLISQKLSEGTLQLIVLIMSPPEDEFDAVENMNILAENISTPSPISLHDYVNANIEGMKTGFQDFTQVQPPTEVTIDGNPAMTLVYTARSPVKESTTVKNLVVFAINGNTGYVMTFAALPETYSLYAPTFERMLQSFKIND